VSGEFSILYWLIRKLREKKKERGSECVTNERDVGVSVGLDACKCKFVITLTALKWEVYPWFARESCSAWVLQINHFCFKCIFGF